MGQEAQIGQYAHGNEPSHHVAWLYAFTDAPQQGRALVAEIAQRFYHDTPDGILGNDDAGQMSAWYVFATLGFYPVEPASAAYVLGRPLVQRARIAVPGRPVLTIVADAGEGNQQSVHFHGAPIATPRISHASLIQGGTLRFAWN